jgi:hypothetical protein
MLWSCMMSLKLIVNLGVDVLGCCRGDVCRSMDLTGCGQDTDVQMTLDGQRWNNALIERAHKGLKVVVSTSNVAQRAGVSCS